MSFKIEILLIPLLQTISHIFEISEDDHPLKIVGHARDHWWTLDLANAFVSTGVKSRGELVPSHGASSRRLGDERILSVLTILRITESYTHYLYTDALFGTDEFWVRGIRKREFSSSGNDVNFCTKPPCDTVFSSRVCEECCKLVT
jgi:hypothetical protein